MENNLTFTRTMEFDININTLADTLADNAMIADILADYSGLDDAEIGIALENKNKILKAVANFWLEKYKED